VNVGDLVFEARSDCFGIIISHAEPSVFFDWVILYNDGYLDYDVDERELELISESG